MERRLSRRRFFAKLASGAAGLMVLSLGAQCGATPTPEATEVVPTETPVVKESPTPAWEAPKRILFVGNSLSFWHDGVETHLKMLAASADPPLTIETSTAYIPGATLKRHWESSSTLKAIQEGGRDVVVLQGYLGVETDEAFYAFARKLDEEIKKAGANTVFFMPWAMKDETGRVTLATEIQERAYNSIGAELGARVAPVGLAWERSLQENPDLNLYDPDGVHPSIYGTYLAACVFYAILFGQSPVGLPYKPVWITEEEATFLQRVAWETVQEYKQPAAD